jgi:hypothetical protein
MMAHTRRQVVRSPVGPIDGTAKLPFHERRGAPEAVSTVCVLPSKIRLDAGFLGYDGTQEIPVLQLQAQCPRTAH